MSCSRHFLYDPQCAACRLERHEEFQKELHEEEMEQAERLEEERRERADREAEREAERDEAARIDREEAAERQEEALRDHARKLKAAAKAAATKHQETTAQAYRLQSRDSSERAQELYDIGSWGAAFAEARKSLELDHGNIQAYRIAAQALEKQDRGPEALEYHREQIRLLGISEYRNQPQLFLIQLRTLPKENAPLFEQFCEQVFANASSWTLQQRLEILSQVVGTVEMSAAEGPIALILSKASVNDQPQLFLTFLRRVTKDAAPWFNRIAEGVLAGARGWTFQDRLNVISELTHSGRLPLAQLLFAIATPESEEPLILLTVLRHLPSDAVDWFDHLSKKVFANVAGWGLKDTEDLLGQLIESGRLSDAKLLTELAFAKADSDKQREIFFAVSRHVSKSSAPWLDQFAEGVFAGAASWTPQYCRGVIGPLIDSGRLSDAMRLAELVFSKPDSSDQPQLFITLLQRLPKENAAWLDRFTERVFEYAPVWTPKDSNNVIGQLIDSKRSNDAQRLAELIFSKLPLNDAPQIYMTLVRRLPKESASWLDQFADKVFANASSWAPTDFVDVVRQLLDVRRLKDAKRLLELGSREADTLEREAYLLEINQQLGIPSVESGKAYLGNIQAEKRFEMLAAFRSIANSPNRFCAATVNLLRHEIEQRYQQWKPRIERNIYDTALNEVAKTEVSGSRTGWALAAAAYMSFIMVGSLAFAVLGVSGAPREQLLMAFGALFAAILVGASSASIAKHNKRIKLAAARINNEVERESQEWRTVCSAGLDVNSIGRSSIRERILILAVVFAAYIFIWVALVASKTTQQGGAYQSIQGAVGNTVTPNNFKARSRLASVTCSKENKLRSGESRTPTTVRFQNNTSDYVKVFWLNTNGQRVYYNGLRPHEWYVQNTYVTHPWVVTDANDRCLVIFLPGQTPDQARVVASPEVN